MEFLLQPTMSCLLRNTIRVPFVTNINGIRHSQLTTITKPARCVDFFASSATEGWEDFLIHPLDYVTLPSTFYALGKR